ncbi:hypothetical protein KM043_010076 [Ampulex compressa]|nr:hypothetical protein KM043_010076 [Ampulex compressa]
MVVLEKIAAVEGTRRHLEGIENIHEATVAIRSIRNPRAGSDPRLIGSPLPRKVVRISLTAVLKSLEGFAPRGTVPTGRNARRLKARIRQSGETYAQILVWHKGRPEVGRQPLQEVEEGVARFSSPIGEPVSARSWTMDLEKGIIRDTLLPREELFSRRCFWARFTLDRDDYERLAPGAVIGMNFKRPHPWYR